jgi:hypothetical protein
MANHALTCFALSLASLLSALTSGAEEPAPPIRHTVFFELRCAPGSSDEAAFFARAAALAEIPDVHEFRRVEEISQKNPYQHGLLMTFESPAAYARYNEHPAHLEFVEEFWIPNVTRFIELDFVAPPNP